MRQRTAAQPTMMRIAIAGAGGLASILAHEITSQTANALLVLSRRPHPEFEENFPGCQVVVVDFDNIGDLEYALTGVDLLISTIPNTEQINLIDAARRARVRVFVPSEFEGDRAHRPTNDPLDNRGSYAALDLLERYSRSGNHRMQFTIFSCGIFMERFAPNGLHGYCGIGGGAGLLGPNDYLVNVEAGTAQILENDARGRPAQVALTSVYDVARFIAAAIEVGPHTWPREIRMRGDHMSVGDIVTTVANVRNIPITPIRSSYQQIESQAYDSQQVGDWSQYFYFQRLLQTANGRYHVRQTNANEVVNQNEWRPMRFRRWLEQVWGAAV